MAAGEVQILDSNKSGINSRESCVVVRDGISYLRILGADPSWQLMTATASEDDGRARVCSNQLRLVEAGLRYCLELNVSPLVRRDLLGREYVTVCNLTRRIGMSIDAFTAELLPIINRFLEIYDACSDIRSREPNEMVALYRSLGSSDLGHGVYLSDGVWLTSDGFLHDRGR
jgi:hypothetical protein